MLILRRIQTLNVWAHDVLLVGGGSGRIKGGSHIRYPKGTPLMNLHLTLLHKLGIPLEKFGDSTGEINLSSV